MNKYLLSRHPVELFGNDFSPPKVIPEWNRYEAVWEDRVRCN